MTPNVAVRTSSTCLANLPVDATTQMSLWLTAAALHLADWTQANLPATAARHSHIDTYRAFAEDLAPGAPASFWPGLLIERERGSKLPLARAAEHLKLNDQHLLAISLAALADEDPCIGALIAEIQGGSVAFPSVETIAQVACGTTPTLGIGWDLVSPLLRAGLIHEVESEGPRSGRPLAVPPLAWDIVRGASEPELPQGVRLRKTGSTDNIRNLAYDLAFRDQVARVPPCLNRSGRSVLILRHMAGADTDDIAAAVAHELKADLLVVDNVPNGPNQSRSIGTIALLSGAIPFLECPPHSGETLDMPSFGQWNGSAILAMGETGGLKPDAAVNCISLTVPFPSPKNRARAWRGIFGEHCVEGFDEICGRFQLPLGHVRDVARAAISEASLAGRNTIQLEDVRLAARSFGREQLDGLADLLPASAGWDDLIVPDNTRTLLEEFAQFCIHREHLPKELGHAPDQGDGRGVRALFTGPSGTGKTLAARLLGEEVGADVYRVDLSAVVDKYVGETEKRLHQLLSRAEALDVILLLDEGDGLMARRTDVNSSNDRFANLETNFLLQRLERHQGIAVVTTNMPEGIDQAFQRRMDVVVPFSRPASDARLELWLRHLPEGHKVPTSALRDLAARAALTGGQIKNAVRAAGSLALTENEPIGPSHLWRGLDRELQKAGAMSGVLRHGETRERQTQSLASFASTISGETS